MKPITSPKSPNQKPKDLMFWGIEALGDIEGLPSLDLRDPLAIQQRLDEDAASAETRAERIEDAQVPEEALSVDPETAAEQDLEAGDALDDEEDLSGEEDGDLGIEDVDEDLDFEDDEDQ